MTRLTHWISTMTSRRRTALVAGIFFVLTFVTSITGLILYGPVLDSADYILGPGADTRISLGAFFEILLIITNIGTAVVLFPILKRQSESIALGYVATRIVEGTIIAAGIVSLLSVVTLRQEFAGAGGADDASLTLAGQTLVAFHDWTFLLGPAFCAGFGNGLLLGYLMYSSRLVPRRMTLLGLIGGPMAFAAATGVLFGFYEQTSAASFLMTLPEIAWEASLGIYLVVKGFKPSPTTAADAREPRLRHTPAASTV
jgi:hypothetical protein